MTSREEWSPASTYGLNQAGASIGRNVASLRPGETDEDTVGVGAVGSGSGALTVTINGVSAEIPITVNWGVHAKEFRFAVEELDEDLTSLHSRLPLLDRDDGNARLTLDGAFDLAPDGHFPIDMRNHFLDGVIEEFQRLVALLRR
jgi:hypothetical protein